ncbi:MAG: tol-pal system protein YbgF [Kofleriaceae bacterium]|nr:tol-pal system protein YbgF [Kofleriaceae bacterium]
MEQRTLRLTLLGLLFTACAGQNSGLVKQNDKLAVELEELRLDARRERVRVRDLEKRLALARAKDVTARNSQTVQSERPNLPVEVRVAAQVQSSVEVRAPATLQSETELPDDYQIMGLDSDGVEIVYVGEAASDTVVKMPRQIFQDYPSGDGVYGANSPPRPSLRTSRLPSRAGLAKALPPIPQAGERLPVQSGAVPTIASQLRQARPSPTTFTTRRPKNFGDPRAEYRRYYEALRAGNHSYAVTGFRNFVERFPLHDFADNAQYWLGEAFYDQKRYQSALAEFRKVVDNHPQGNKVPDALLKLGYCYYQTGATDDAKQVWQQVLRVYPKSNPANLARTKLAEIEE